MSGTWSSSCLPDPAVPDYLYIILFAQQQSQSLQVHLMIVGNNTRIIVFYRFV